MAVHRTLPCLQWGKPPSDQVALSCLWFLPRNPDKLAQMASDVRIKLLKYAFTFIQSKVQSPPPQNRIQLCDGRLQGCPSGAMEDVLQLVAESCEALGVRSGRARRADEGVAEKFRSVRAKHAALVTVYPQLERPLYVSNQVLEHTLSRSFTSDVDVVVVCVAREFQAALFQILVELVQDDQRQDRAQRRALWGSFVPCLHHAF